MKSFEKKYSDGNARVLLIKSGDRKLLTPCLLPCATRFSVHCLGKTIIGKNPLIVNALHAEMFPGSEKIKSLGGIHRVTGLHNSVHIADSGGFQILKFATIPGVFNTKLKEKPKNSVASPVLVSNKHVFFRSYETHQIIKLDPLRLIEIQENIGADFKFVLDHFPIGEPTRENFKNSLDITNNWLKKASDKIQQDKLDGYYAVMHGGTHEDLRNESALEIKMLEGSFFGIGIGGYLGKDQQEMHETMHKCGHVIRNINLVKPIHCLGVGKVKDIFEGVIAGFDSFDCSYFTRAARRGIAIVADKNNNHLLKFRTGLINHENFNTPIQEGCKCFTCKNYSISEIALMFKTLNTMYYHLLAIHNYHFMDKLLKLIRRSIMKKQFVDLKQFWL